jgi:diketogulonate reductase-like aldo/keto reductase
MSVTLNDGTTAPWLAFGTGTAHFNKEACQPVTMAINAGISHLDGAQVYNNEDSLGAGIKAAGKPRSELYIVTKLMALEDGQNVRDALVLSLKKLQVDYVDLFLIHSPVPFAGKLKGVWKEMEEVKKEGLTKSIGVSNFGVDYLREVMDGATVIPAVNQIEYHPYVLDAAKPIAKFSKEHNIAIASYGGLTPLVRATGGPVDPVLIAISARLGNRHGKPVTAGQILIKWMKQKGLIVVTTTSKEERVKECLDVSTLPDLTVEEIEAIEEAGCKLHKRVYMRAAFNE